MRKLLFIAGTHGNEAFAVDVLRQIENAYPKEKYSYDWIVGNPRAVAGNVRYVEKDLNRSAPGNAKGAYEERRAAEIMSMSDGFDAVIDLHGTSAGCGLVKIIPYPTKKAIALALAIPLDRNVIWYSERSEENGPLAHHTTCPALEIECGPKTDPKTAEALHETVAAILKNNLKKDLFDGDEQRSQSFYNVYGKLKGAPDNSLQDFIASTRQAETFFPFLSRNSYVDITCYKMSKISPKEISYCQERRVGDG